MQVSESKIAELLNKEWSLKDRGLVKPDADDVLAALDEAARVLYDEPVGTRLEVGGLIIEKRPTTHEIYVYIGDYD